MPRMKLMDSYADQKKTGPLPSTAHVGYLLRAAPDWDYVAALREAWDGHLILKGVMEADVAARAEGFGVDAIWVSNHAGRQFDGAPASLDALRMVRGATTLPLIFDSGIEGGLDILRALERMTADRRGPERVAAQLDLFERIAGFALDKSPSAQ